MVTCYGKNRIRSTNLRTIRGSFPRFLSLMIMSFLGVFVFAGLMATAPDMIITLDRNLDAHSVYDIRVISDMGLTQEDAEAIAALEGVEAVEAGRSLDAIASYGDGDCVIHLAALPETLNRIDLVAGRLPQRADEIVVEEEFLKKESLALGDTITLDSDSLTAKTLSVVGTVNSPLYYNNVMISQNRGNTSIGSGTVRYYAYGTDDLFDMAYDTVIYLTVSGASEEITSESGYTARIDSVMDGLAAIKSDREQARYDSIRADGQKKIDEARADAEEELKAAWQKLEDAGRTLDSTKSDLQAAEGRLAALRAQLDAEEAELAAAGALLSSEARLAAEAQLQAAEEQYALSGARYAEGLAAYEEGLADYEEGVRAYNSAKAEADERLAEAEAELDGIDMPTWYLYDRTGYSTYNDYIDDANSLRNLATLFPIVFFAVAVLVSLISMNRMVEENRLEIGTMKSMGFPDSMILSKYLVFSLLATIIGGALGAVGGLIIIPELIYGIYSILFTLPALTLTLQPGNTLLGFLLTVICVCGSGVWTVWKALKEKPADLLRPKSPKKGKRILLERIPAIWNRMKFSRKVTARNIFRYRKRVLVTVGGIAGCTALMLSGFGVKDAIFDISSMQYYDIYQFDATAYVSDYGEGVRAEDLLEYAPVTAAVPAQRITADIEEIDGFLQILERDEDLKEIALFRDDASGELLRLEPGKAIVNEKLAALTGLRVGDEITLTDVDNRTLTIEIGGIARNYIENFVFMDAETYTSMGYTFAPNLIYLHTAALDRTGKDALAAEVLCSEYILNFTYRDTLIDNVDNSLQSLNSVVLILIVLSALLAFVVLYNLSNININERKREIASLKVLGFYDNEVDSYITRETILLTVIGIGLGLLLGIFLSHAVVKTIEIEKCRFLNTLKPMSYVWTALITASFTLIVNIITHFNLKRIDMIDSLKSVE